MPFFCPLSDKIGPMVFAPPQLNSRVLDAMVIIHSGGLMARSAHQSPQGADFQLSGKCVKRKFKFVSNLLHNRPPILGLPDTLMRSDRHHLTFVAPILHFRDFSTNLLFLGIPMILCYMFVPREYGVHLKTMWECCVKLCTTSSSF